MRRATLSRSKGGYTTRMGFALLGFAFAAASATVSCSSGSIVNNGQGGAGGSAGSGGKGGNTQGTGAAGGSTFVFTTPDASSADRPTGGTCGDGVIERNESCDDGNTVSGDGCSRICQVENNYECKEAGKPCRNLAVCGNGILTSDETCDDGNTVDGDGCSHDCKTVEPGWQCRVPGKACTPKCGDGVVSGTETCDDGNTNSGDGCSATCHLEIGYKCDKPGAACTKTTCGDGKKEGAEGCDDGNTMPFDGCSEDCQIEPTCAKDGSGCTSQCGDGLVLPSEGCDDGNAANGDGCSQDCKAEPGWTCTQPDLGDKMMVPVIYRDFHFSGKAGTSGTDQNDFENGVSGQRAAATGMVKDTLDADGKPVYANPASPPGNVHVASADSFATWFRTQPDSAKINHADARKLALWKNADGAYVNRYGPNGEQWNITQNAYWCGTVGQEKKDSNGKAIPCTFAQGTTDCDKMDGQGYTQLKCFTDSAGTTYQALYSIGKVDGNPLFFPIDDDPFSKAEMTGAQVPSDPANMYDASGTWPWDLDAAGNKILHNFSFTSEVRYWFKYDSSKPPTLDFVGDDDVWVFINRKLAVDLGGIHTPVEGSVTLDATSAGKLGLKSGGVYEIAVFQAERQTTCSSYKLTLSGFNAAPSSCVPTCGDGVVVADEECDCGTDPNNVPSRCPGPNDDNLYGGCTTECKWGSYCGDNIVNGTEECDDGRLNGTDASPNGCTLGCTKKHYCGDGIADTDRGEECDLGDKNGQKLDTNLNPTTDDTGQIYCNADCTIPPDIVY